MLRWGLGREAVQRHAVGLQLLGQRLVRVDLDAGPFHAVVVQEQLSLRVGLVRPAEGVGHDARAEFTDEDVFLAVLAILVEDLVGDVPLLDLAAVVADHREDVVLEDRAQLRLGELALGQPRRVLAVPEQGVPADDLTVLPRELDDRVGRAEVVLAALGVDEFPLHLVLGGDRVEFAGQDLPVRLVVGERVRVVLLEVVAAARRRGSDAQVAGCRPAQRQIPLARVVVHDGPAAGRLRTGLGRLDAGAEQRRRGEDGHGDTVCLSQDHSFEDDGRITHGMPVLKVSELTRRDFSTS
ncbi:hypothetical protein GCM10020358_78290 [Amorphoplanes nipponensis]